MANNLHKKYRILREKWSDGATYFIPQRKSWFGWKSYTREIGYQYSIKEMFETLHEAQEFLRESIEMELIEL